MPPLSRHIQGPAADICARNSGGYITAIACASKAISDYLTLRGDENIQHALSHTYRCGADGGESAARSWQCDAYGMTRNNGWKNTMVAGAKNSFNSSRRREDTAVRTAHTHSTTAASTTYRAEE